MTDPRGHAQEVSPEPYLGEESVLGAGARGGAPQAGTPAMAPPTPTCRLEALQGGSHPRSREMRPRTHRVLGPGSPGCTLLPRTPGVRKHSQDSEHRVTNGELRPPTLVWYRRPSGSRPSTVTCSPSGTLEPYPPRPPRQGRGLGGLASSQGSEGGTPSLSPLLWG